MRTPYPPPFRIARREKLLVATFAEPQRMLSWSLNRPGLVAAHEVAFVEVRDAELPEMTDAHALLAARLEAAGHLDAVGLMTSRDIRHHHLSTRQVDGVGTTCLLTLGLNNGERVGSRHAGAVPAVGTVNILAASSVPLTDAALVEALSIVVQARTLGILEAAHMREGQEEPVTGTGTDCIVMSAPQGEGAICYAGLHTAIGEALGAAVLQATRQAADQWMLEHRRARG